MATAERIPGLKAGTQLERSLEPHLKSVRSVMQFYWQDLDDIERQTILAKICSYFVNSVVIPEKVPECLKLCGDMAQKYLEKRKQELGK